MFEKSKYVSADRIEVSVVIPRFSPAPTEANFVLLKAGKLCKGNVASCLELHSHGSVIQDSSWDMTQKFSEVEEYRMQRQ
ncbi:unnamed protein product [Caenorhabditis brenneri]